MKKVVIYSGRFQPMLSHHAEVYNRLQMEFPDADIYIGTSDKVEGSKSPFNFKEKQLIAQAHGIDPNKVLLAKRPYHKDDYAKYFNEDSTQIFFAVGEKDLDRFPFNNIDDSTGLDMTVRGEPKPKYYQKINTYKQDPQPMSMRGYITLAPTVQAGDEVASASAFRSAMQNAPTEVKAIEIYTKQFGEFNQQVFDLIYKKIKGSEMNENINILRKLAGLQEAPVEFDVEANPKEVTFLQPSANSTKLSIANRFPADADPNDPEVKKDEFVKALMKSPASLLSEINERLDPKDSNNEAVGVKLNKIISQLEKVGIQQLDPKDKSFVIDVVKVAIKDMDLIAGDDSEPEFDDEPEDEYRDWDDEISKSNKTSAAVGNMEPIEDSVDLSDIKGEYGVEEGSGEEHFCQECNGSGCEKCDDTGVAKEYQDDYNGSSVEEGFDPDEFDGEIDWEGVGDDGETSPCTVSYVAKVDEMGRPVVDPKSIRIDCQMDGNSKLGFDPDFDLQMQDMDELLQACQEDADEMWDSRDNKYAHGESIEEAMCGCCGNDPCDCAPDCKGCKSMDEAVDSTVNNALDAAIQELRTLAGLNS